MDWGEIAQTRLAEIARCSETTDGVTRLPFTPSHEAALQHISAWMHAAGLAPEMDAAATLVGRSSKRGPAFLIGSHQDSVHRGGRYDGIMGIAIGCLALEQLRSAGKAPAVPVEVLAFADEEGVRFPTALIGPRALAGTFDPGCLELRDQKGISLAAALSSFGGDPVRMMDLRRAPETVRGYLEVHIEQGPVLEASHCALGVVTGICGIERNRVCFEGETGHAGTVPMQGRRDALVAASRFIAEVADCASCEANLRVTIGTLRVWPDAVNAIPDRVELTLELRAPEDEAREAFALQADQIGTTIADVSGTSYSRKRTYVQAATPCDPALTRQLQSATGASVLLPSGATHDASAMADLCPISMLFVRCEGGRSHRPDEMATSADLAEAIDATAQFLMSLRDQ